MRKRGGFGRVPPPISSVDIVLKLATDQTSVALFILCVSVVNLESASGARS